MDTIASMRARTPRFGELVQRIREKGTDSLAHFQNGYTHEGGYSLQQNPDEFAALIQLFRERAGLFWIERGVVRPLYLEIGSASGGSLRLLHEIVGFDFMWSIDNHGHHRWVEQEENWRGLGVDAFVGDSHGPEAAQWLAKQYEEHAGRLFAAKTPTFAFIDGDHSYEGCAADVQLVRPHLASGSLIIFHDTVACDGVKRAFEETTAWARLVANYVGSSRPLGIGVLEVE